MVFWIGLYIACGVRDNVVFRSCLYNFCPWLQKESFFSYKMFQASLEHLNLPEEQYDFSLEHHVLLGVTIFLGTKLNFIEPFFNSL